MKQYNFGVVESKFADIIWEHEPLRSRDLVRLCASELNWNKSTTYTMLRRVCEKGIFQNVDSMVSACISKDEFIACKSEEFVEETFGGSLPEFIAAFTKRKPLTQEELEEINCILNKSGKE